MEVGTRYAKHLLEIFHATERGIFSADYQQVLEWRELAYGLAFLLNLFRREHGALEGIVVVETAVHALVGAGVAHVHGDVHGDGITEFLLREVVGELRHLFEVRVGGFGD